MRRGGNICRAFQGHNGEVWGGQDGCWGESARIARVFKNTIWVLVFGGVRTSPFPAMCFSLGASMCCPPATFLCYFSFSDSFRFFFKYCLTF